MMSLHSILVTAAVSIALSSVAAGADYFVYTGTYTNGPSKGIYLFRFQSATGKLVPMGLAAESASPSFLAIHPNRRFVYAVNEGNGAGSVSAFAADSKTGKLTPINSVPSQGNGPCHLALDQTGKWLAVANYGSGHLAILPVAADGKLGDQPVAVVRNEGSGPNKSRQQGPHAHEAVFSPDSRFLLLADLGLDKIFVYRFDAATGKITPNDPPSASVAPGAGVRHMAFHPNGKIVYAINEMGNTITAFQYDAAKGALTQFQTISTLPEGFTGNSSTAEIAVNGAGTVLYGSNRGHDSIAIFAIDPVKFTLTAKGHVPTLGKTPRHFALDPSGSFLLAENQNSNSIAVFKVHASTGDLTPMKPATVETPVPVCVLFLEAR
jgi:6-phosphogluconolactonase